MVRDSLLETDFHILDVAVGNKSRYLIARLQARIAMWNEHPPISPDGYQNTIIGQSCRKFFYSRHSFKFLEHGIYGLIYFSNFFFFPVGKSY